MTLSEHDQLRIWGRYDSYYLAILWTLSFIALMNASFFQPLLLVNEVLLLVTPFFVYYRLRKFRDEGRGGVISYQRALSYLCWMFLNACLILGFVQYFYLRLWDDGQLVRLMTPKVSTPEYEQMFRQMGMTSAQYLEELSAISPLSFATTFFVVNLIVCGLLSLFLAALGARSKTPVAPQQSSNQETR